MKCIVASEYFVYVEKSVDEMLLFDLKKCVAITISALSYLVISYFSCDKYLFSFWNSKNSLLAYF